MGFANLVMQNADVPGNPVLRAGLGIPHLNAPPVEEVVVERIHSGVCTQDIDPDATAHN